MVYEHVPVLIVGGGTVGLSTAVALARHGVRSLVVERRATTSIHPRATGVQPPAREFFRAMGLEERMREASADLAPSMSKVNLSPSLADGDLAAAPRFPTPPLDVLEVTRRISPTDIGPCSQDQIDRMLVAAAADRGVEVRFCTELESLTQDDSGVTVTLLDNETGERRDVRADYVVGADGASSRTRRALGLTMSGLDKLGEPMINMMFRADLRDLVAGNEFAFAEIRTGEIEGILLTINNKDRWVFHFTYDADKESLEDYPPERCAQIVRKVVGRPGLEVEVLARLAWQMSARVADKLRVGRVLMAGDAAHTIPPVGAFGMSTGIGDAYNLSWKLAMVINGEAGPGLLDTYDQERLPIAEFTCEQARLRFRFMELHWDNSPEGEAEKAKLRIADPLVTGFGFQYTRGAVIDAREELPSLEDVEQNLDGSPGSRLPHVWVERKGEKVSTLDLAGAGFALLLGPDATGWRQAADRLNSELPVTAYRLGPDGDVRDADDRAIAQIGITGEGAVLVRPDNFVAWRSAGARQDADERLAGVLNALLDRSDAGAAASA
ncbi:FAD-dependent monooxygenase [Microbispora bryophytorum]|uniref:FAD-dependent monooxygenase n=1 Tax=Microbispora bryophytorum TaxID=1460882 RepID=UPI0033F48A5F